MEYKVQLNMIDQFLNLLDADEPVVVTFKRDHDGVTYYLVNVGDNEELSSIAFIDSALDTLLEIPGRYINHLEKLYS